MTRASHHLIDISLAVIHGGQMPEGAYLAAPSFPNYRYSWFRDGAFIAEAMDDWGEHESASAFHTWAIHTLLGQLEALSPLQVDSPPEPEQQLHTRYQANGTASSEAWPNFQLDGFGTWLWAYHHHIQRTSCAPSAEALRVVKGLSDYLIGLWSQPNYDCWEEHPDRIHPATLGALYAGLKAAAELVAMPAYAGAAESIRSYLLFHGTINGHFSKHVSSQTVDASLLWLATPYQVVPADHPLARNTAAKIRAELQDPEGGVHRYATDSYYGGGSWLLLTAALAQDHLSIGEHQEAERLVAWLESHATPEGHLPEQAADHLNSPDDLLAWQKRWGPSACPLLWSHAAYLNVIKRLIDSKA